MIYVTTILIIAILATYLLLKILIEIDYKSLFLPLLAGWCALRFLLKIIKPYPGDRLIYRTCSIHAILAPLVSTSDL